MLRKTIFTCKKNSAEGALLTGQIKAVAFVIVKPDVLVHVKHYSSGSVSKARNPLGFDNQGITGGCDNSGGL
jgi:hypothetical protein